MFLHSHVNTNYHSIAHNDFTTKDLFSEIKGLVWIMDILYGDKLNFLLN